MTMKKWPEDGKPATAEELLTPVRALLHHGMMGEGVVYEGYDIGEREKATCISPDERFTHEGLVHSNEQGRDFYDEVLLLAFQLGIEQGRRLKEAEPMICNRCGMLRLGKTSLECRKGGEHYWRSIERPVVCRYCGRSKASWEAGKDQTGCREHEGYPHEWSK